jgi:thiosulfate/3-mercaptopyruvate sulfurtransferase
VPARIAAIAAFVALLYVPSVTHAAGPRDALVISVPALAAKIHDPDLVLLHVGDRKEYDKAHLPGARYVSFDDISVSDHSGVGLHLEMLPADTLRQHLAALGIGDRSQVVVYYGNDWVSPATRVVFTLDYAGLGNRTMLLDGGQPAWVRASQPVTAEVPAPRTATLSPLSLEPIVVDAAFVRSHLSTPGFAVVDGRDGVFYDGVETGNMMNRPHKTGHIRGARSVPFSEIADEQNVLKSAADLEQLFTKAGVRPGDTIIGYCHIGQQATAMLFAARTLGHPVLLYDGSFEDWSRQADSPVDNPSAK